MRRVRCLAGRDCRNASTADGQRQGAFTEKADTLCPACSTHMIRAVRELPRDWTDLRNALGERATTAGTKIRSTPTPAIPISTRKEALMAAIIDMADRAAAIVSDRLHTEQPTGRRKPPPDAEQGSIAWCAAQHRHPEQIRALQAAIAITEPHLDILAAAPPEDAVVWTKPQRCDVHARLIGAIEELIVSEPRPAERAAAENQLRRAYAAAGLCDDCNGWGQHGQERQLVELGGIQILTQLVDLHHQTRAELGLTRLRHTYTMPCPDCGAGVYRNDGESIVICEGNAKHTCTEREYKVRAGLLLEEEMYKSMAEYLLAEAYWRLDRMQKLITNMGADPNINLPGAGALILEKLQSILNGGVDINGKPIGHLPPEKRAAGTDKKAARQRQVDEDNWTWRNEKRYQPTKSRLHKMVTRPDSAPRIHAGSLSTLVDIDNRVAERDSVCPICNLVRPCDCV